MNLRGDSIPPTGMNGIQIRDYTAALALSSSLAHIRVPPGARHTLSWSTRSDKYYYILSGALHFEVDGTGSTLGTGDVCIVKKGQPFTYENRSDGPVEMILFHTPSFEMEAEVFQTLGFSENP